MKTLSHKIISTNKSLDTILDEKEYQSLTISNHIQRREIGLNSPSFASDLYLYVLNYIKNAIDDYEKLTDFQIKSHEKFRTNELFKEILRYDNPEIKSFDINLLMTAMIDLGFDINHKDRWTTVWPEGHTYTPLVATFYKLISDKENTNHYLNLFEVFLNHGADLRNETTFFSCNIQDCIENNYYRWIEKKPTLDVLLELIEKFEKNNIG